MNKHKIRLLAMILVAVSLNTFSFAQTRIKFARGRSAATLKGTIASGATREFWIDVRQGQTMTVQITSGSNKIDLEISGRSGHLEWGDNGFAQIEIYESGDHAISIRNSGRSTTAYTMTVTVR